MKQGPVFLDGEGQYILLIMETLLNKKYLRAASEPLKSFFTNYNLFESSIRSVGIYVTVVQISPLGSGEL